MRGNMPDEVRMVVSIIILQILGNECLVPVKASPPYAAAVKPCGEVKCLALEYCATEHSPHCRPCSEICGDSGPVVDYKICSQHCQDYIYDMKFEEGFKKVENEIASLRKVSIIAVVFATVAVVTIIFLLAVHWSPKLKSHLFGLSNTKKKASSVAAVINGCKSTPAMANSSGNLRLNMSRSEDQRALPDPPSAGATTMTTLCTTSVPSTPYCGKNGVHTPATISTPLSTRPPRHPSEDATLEHAYDNHALSQSSENVLNVSVSPPAARGRESSF